METLEKILTVINTFCKRQKGTKQVYNNNTYKLNNYVDVGGRNMKLR